MAAFINNDQKNWNVYFIVNKGWDRNFWCLFYRLKVLISQGHNFIEQFSEYLPLPEYRMHLSVFWFG